METESTRDSTGSASVFQGKAVSSGSHGPGSFRSIAADGAVRRRASLKGKERSTMPDPRNQCIHCGVESCRHLKQEQGICALDSIQVAPAPMAYSGDPADESMCQSYDCK